jgi:TetR/AcrR family transcriptional regulator, ethionamide resistance regulator
MATYSERRAAGGIKNGHGERRRSSRERLLEAARALFFEQDYLAISVDDIARAAGLSRAGFYLHYPSKEAILVDIAREESARLDPLYRWFAGGSRTPPRKDVRKFVQLAIRLSKRSRRQMSLLYQATGYNAEIWGTFTQNRQRHIDMLGETLPAFRDCKRSAAVERKRRAHAFLLIVQLEQLTIYATFAADNIDTEATAEALAGDLHAFIEEYHARPNS